MAEVLRVGSSMIPSVGCCSSPTIGWFWSTIVLPLVSFTGSFAVGTCACLVSSVRVGAFGVASGATTCSLGFAGSTVIALPGVTSGFAGLVGSAGGVVSACAGLGAGAGLMPSLRIRSFLPSLGVNDSLGVGVGAGGVEVDGVGEGVGVSLGGGVTEGVGLGLGLDGGVTEGVGVGLGLGLVGGVTGGVDGCGGLLGVGVGLGELGGTGLQALS